MNIQRFHFFQQNRIACLMVLPVALVLLGPLLLLGQDGIVAIHDNLDWLPLYRMFRDDGLFFVWDAPTRFMDGLSTLYCWEADYSYQSLLFLLFPLFEAYVVLKVSMVVMAFCTMLLLLHRLVVPPNWIAVGVALCYAALPLLPVWTPALASLPLAPLLFLRYAARERFTPEVFWIILLPFFSSFSVIGMFLIGLWAAATLLLWGIRRRWNVNLAAGWILLTAGYVLVDLKLFYLMLVVREPVNRALIPPQGHFFQCLWDAFAIGLEHADGHAMPLVLPLTAAVLFTGLVMRHRQRRNETATFPSPSAIKLSLNAARFRLLVWCAVAILGIGVVAACGSCGAVQRLTAPILPMLNGFNWARILVFQLPLYYLGFALALSFLSDQNGRWKKAGRILAICMLGGQLCWILFSDTLYNDSLKNWRYIRHLFSGHVEDSEVTWREFFSTPLFQKIQNDLDYQGEKVMAFGFHPSVLVYNGFNCIDGYNSLHSQAAMQKFRRLIAPTLNTNPSLQQYFDAWGGRFYLYNPWLTWIPTKKHEYRPVELAIDRNVLIHEYGARYLLSRVPVLNARQLGLELLGLYEMEGCLYRILVYRIPTGPAAKSE